MKLSLLPETFAVCRLDPEAPIPEWALFGPFYSISKTSEELSIVCEDVGVPSDVKAERDWRVFKVEGPLDFSLTGVLASIANPLAEAGVSIFAVSTFDTDYVMVRAGDVAVARESLMLAGFHVRAGDE
jgi:uncharacterized protein